MARVRVGACQYCKSPIFTESPWYSLDNPPPVEYTCNCHTGAASPHFDPKLPTSVEEHKRVAPINARTPLAETKESIDVPVAQIRHGTDNSGGNASGELISEESIAARENKPTKDQVLPVGMRDPGDRKMDIVLEEHIARKSSTSAGARQVGDTPADTNRNKE